MTRAPEPATPLRRHLRQRRSVGELLSRLPARASRAGNLFSIELEPFTRCGLQYGIPKFVFIGPVGGDTRLRIGLFAGLHGDEEAGCEALVDLIAEFHETPELAAGLELHIFPVCNPSGYEDGTRWARGGPDLNREFWKNSPHPEVRLLETQLRGLAFDGLVALHADDTSDGIYGYVAGDVLTKNLLEPALRAAEEILPRNRTPRIDGWRASDGIIEEGFSGVLSAPPEQKPKPFEIVFETPASADVLLQAGAHRAALLAIFEAAIALRAHAANI